MECQGSQAEDREQRTYSDTFYVGLSSVRVSFWNHDNLGVFIHIMIGDFDEKLHWPIRYKHTFVLINQVNSKDNLVSSDEVTKGTLEKYPNCFKRPTEHRNTAFGTRSLISNTQILEEKYYKQDSVTLHISVEVLPSL